MKSGVSLCLNFTCESVNSLIEESIYVRSNLICFLTTPKPHSNSPDSNSPPAFFSMDYLRTVDLLLKLQVISDD